MHQLTLLVDLLDMQVLLECHIAAHEPLRLQNLSSGGRSQWTVCCAVAVLLLQGQCNAEVQQHGALHEQNNCNAAELHTGCKNNNAKSVWAQTCTVT